MSWIDTIFGGGREQAGKDIYNQMNQGWKYSQGLMNPYIGNNQAIYNQYLNAINQGQDPVQLYNQFAGQYQMTPEAQAQIQQGIEGANRAAAASGMLGSGAEMTHAADIAQSTRSQDFNDYMNRVLGLRSQYLGGLGGLENQGFEGSEFMGALGQKYFEDMAQGKAAQDMGRAGGISNLIGTGLGLAGDIFGGGFGGSGGWLGNLFQGGGLGNWGNPHASGWQDPNLDQPF